MSPPQSPSEPPRRSVRERARRYLAELASLVTRNGRHRDRLDGIEHRISVSGTRGKSTMVRWLHDELVDAGYDTYAKITGTEPLSVFNGQEWIVPRRGRTTLYENERELRRFFPMDAVVVENQGITPYTTRLVNTRYVRPTLVVVTNIREDHLDTLGSNREQITRALARSVPADAHVICGEQGASVRRYFARELSERRATVTFVDIPTGVARVPGAELVYCLDEAMRFIEGTGLGRRRAEAYLDDLRVEWLQLPEGRVFDAAEVNDVQSTEAVRRSLVGDSGAVVQPLVCLRRDRPGRTDSFIQYLDHLAEQNAIERARVVDGHSRAFRARASFPVVAHSGSEDPESVLSAALSDGWPVVLMGNANPEFMQEMREVIASKAAAAGRSRQERADGTPATPAADGTQTLVLDRSPASSDDVRVDLTAAGSPDRVLCILFEQTPDECLNAWRGQTGGPDTDQLEVITVGEKVRSVAATPGSGPGQPETTLGGVSVTAVEDVYELGGFLRATLGEQQADGRSVGAYLDSIPQLIAEHSLEDAFRVLILVINQLKEAGTTAHYHFPMEHADERSARTVVGLFDTVVTINEDGERRVQE